MDAALHAIIVNLLLIFVYDSLIIYQEYIILSTNKLMPRNNPQIMLENNFVHVA